MPVLIERSWAGYDAEHLPRRLSSTSMKRRSSARVWSPCYTASQTSSGSARADA